jgi:prolyl-tRNA editing enzyme YbaK/EbsC (Cys-tRNA(Pro) deacylase)
MLTASDLAHFVEQNAVAAEVIHLPVHTPTVEQAARAVNSSPNRIVKSLLFLVSGKPTLAIACGPSRVDSRAIAAHFGVAHKQVTLADAEAVLTETGYPVGALPPFGHLRPLPTVIDRRVLLQSEVFAGGGSVDALVRVSPGEIVRLTGAVPLDLQHPSPPGAGGLARP